MRYLLPFLAVALLFAGCNRPHTARPFESLTAAMPVVEIATTTTTLTTAPPEHRSIPRASRTENLVPGKSVLLGDLLDDLAECESGRNPRAHSGPFWGAFQDTLTTWHDIGGRGNPIDFDYATQKALNARIPMSSWHRQFPACSRRIGV